MQSNTDHSLIFIGEILNIRGHWVTPHFLISPNFTLQIPLHDDALGFLLTFGSTNNYLVQGLAPWKSYAMPGTHD